MALKKIKIAIDGPAASGKSTTARRVAAHLGYLYIDSGALYRAVTLMALRHNIPVTDVEKVAQIAQALNFKIFQKKEDTRMLLNGEDVSLAIRRPEITQHINPVARNVLVRELLVKKLREMGKQGGIVMDGRDIGTVVFPDAELKIFMKASAKERARRRVNELHAKGIPIQAEAVLAEIKKRDDADKNRKYGPLRKAPDAIEINTTSLSIDEQVAKIISLALEKINAK